MKIFILVIGILLVTAAVILSSSKKSQEVVQVQEMYKGKGLGSAFRYLGKGVVAVGAAGAAGAAAINYRRRHRHRHRQNPEPRRRRRTPEPKVNVGAPSCPKIGSDDPLQASGWTYQGCFKESASTNMINQGVLEIDLDSNNNPARTCAEYLAANVPSANVMGIQQIYPLENGVKPSKVHCYYATDPTYKQYSTLGCETDASACNMYLPGRANQVYTRAYDPNKHRYKKNTAPGVVKSTFDPSTIITPSPSPSSYPSFLYPSSYPSPSL